MGRLRFPIRRVVRRSRGGARRGSLAVMSADLLIIACTVCDSPGSASLREALFADADFASNLLAVVLPSAMCFGVVALMHVRGGRPEDRR